MSKRATRYKNGFHYLLPDYEFGKDSIIQGKCQKESLSGFPLIFPTNIVIAYGWGKINQGVCERKFRRKKINMRLAQVLDFAFPRLENDYTLDFTVHKFQK